MLPLLPPKTTPPRQKDLARLGHHEWDLLVVGGGISGVALARDGALRGLRTALVEQDDLAAGTSSRSSRLIHGGLRYLEEGEMGLVREGLVERRRLLRSAPGLVRPVSFIFPVYRQDPDPLWKVRLGLWLYDLLAAGYGLGRHRRLTPTELATLAPLLRREGLQGALRYRDGATHDARLTLAVAVAARRAGATLVSRCQAEGFLRRGEGIAGVHVRDRLSETSFDVKARVVVLCSGPWQELLEPVGVRLTTARGTHVSLPAPRLPLEADLALRSPRDGRLVFALPAGPHTILGTTDVLDPTPPARVAPAPEDVDYLLEAANHTLPGADLSREDLVGAWAGLRPLLADPGEEETEALSRRHLVVKGPPGLWALTGGKLTIHRRMAEDCLDRILKEAPFDHPVGPCRTRKEPLFPASLDEGRRRLLSLGLEETRVDELMGLYGARLSALGQRWEEILPAQGGPADETLFQAQVALAVEEEWALSLDDLLLRRLAPGLLDLHTCWELAPGAARLMAQGLGWSAEEEARQVEEFRRRVATELTTAGLPVPGRRTPLAASGGFQERQE